MLREKAVLAPFHYASVSFVAERFLNGIDTPFHASFASSRHSSHYLNRITQIFGGMSSYLYFCSQKTARDVQDPFFTQYTH